MGTMENRKKSKVAVYFCNGIGNWLMLTPAIQALSQLYNSPVDIVMPSENTDSRMPIIHSICQQWDVVKNLILFPDQNFYPDKYKVLFTTSHCEPSHAKSLFDQKGINYRSAKWLGECIHEIEYYMSEVYRLGYKGVIPPIRIPITDKPKLGHGIKIAFYNGAASLSERYRWERKKWTGFSALANELHNCYDVDIIYLGGKSEAKEGQELENKYEFVKNFAGKINFLESAYALSQCNLMISTDSALMHIAEAVNVPVIALFGATMVSKNRPFNGEYKIVRGKCRYSPCQYHPQFNLCRDYQCMKSITTGSVINIVMKMENTLCL